jgi:hypothetical protein
MTPQLTQAAPSNGTSSFYPQQAPPFHLAHHQLASAATYMAE